MTGEEGRGRGEEEGGRRPARESAARRASTHPELDAAARRTSTPPELDAAMTRALEGKADPGAYDLLGAAEALLDKVLSSNCEVRSAALDLLTVDALITRAVGAAANEPELAETFAEYAMQR